MTQTNGAQAPTKNQALATREDSQAMDLRTDRAAFEPGSLAQAYDLAQKLCKSGLMPRALNSPEAVVTAVIMGRELGLTAMQSVRSIHVIEGKPALSSALIVALVKKSPVCKFFMVVESTDEIATYETQREGDPKPTKMSFTIAQARAAGVTGKDNWRKFPAAMLRARCETALARAVYPDLVMGLYDPDELERVPAEPQPPVVRDVTPPKAEPQPPVVNVVLNPAPAPAIETTARESTPAPAGGPQMTAAALLTQGLIERAAKAATGDDLTAIASETNAAKRKGQITPGDFEAVKVAVQSRRQELAKAGGR